MTTVADYTTLRAALERIAAHRDDDGCDGERCDLHMMRIAEDALRGTRTARGVKPTAAIYDEAARARAARRGGSPSVRA